MNCLICRNKLTLYGKIGKQSIFKCGVCGFGVTEGVNLQKGDYHRDETYKIEEKLFYNIFQKRAKIISKLMKPGSALEVGSSTGIFLSILKMKGWEVEGIEPSKSSAKVASDNGLNINVTTFEKFETKQKYDLIILNHTLEHLSDPINIVKKAKMLLKPKGCLYIDVPNFESLSAKILRTHWPLLLPKEHLWHFTEKAFRKLLTDFKIIYVNKSSGIWDYGNPGLGLIQSFLGFKKRFFKEIITAKFSFVISKLGKGSDLMVIARKK